MQRNSQTKVELEETPHDATDKISVPVEQDEVISEEKPNVTGVVTDCLKLNIREAPSTDVNVIAVIPALTEVIIDMNESNDSFYKVCTATGIQGFCMKKYIAVRQ